jgi:TfoX/Sxy family transcriptional regulator of competence genes
VQPGGMPRPTAEDLAAFDALLPDHPEVTRRPMFGNAAGFARGQMFLCLFGSAIAVRLDDAGRSELLSHPGAAPFVPIEGRPMKEYVVLPPDWTRDQRDTWVERSLAYALSLPPKPAKPSKQAQPKPEKPAGSSRRTSSGG